MSLFSNFWSEVEIFFSDVGTTFLSNLKTAWPVLEQAGLNFLVVIADAVVKAIESGAIPLPVLAVEPGATVDIVAAKLANGRAKQLVAFNAIQAQLVKTPPPTGIVIRTSLINAAIEISVAKNKQMGNGGNFPGGNNFAVAGA
jgi:hypothetical protein